MRIYSVFRRRENKANSKPNKAKSRPLVGNPKLETLNPKKRHLTETNLKKQTQFLNEQNNVKSILTMVYRNIDEWRRPENKANQSQSVRSVRPALPFSELPDWSVDAAPDDAPALSAKELPDWSKLKNWIPACAGMTVSKPRWKRQGRWLDGKAGNPGRWRDGRFRVLYGSGRNQDKTVHTKQYGEIENEETRVPGGGEYCADSRYKFIGGGRQRRRQTTILRVQAISS